MKTNTKSHLVTILEKTENPKTKRVVSGLLDVINNSEVDDPSKTAGIVTESLKNLAKEDKHVKEFFDYMNVKAILENLGMKSVIKAVKGTKLYEGNDEFRTMIDVYEEHSKNAPEYVLADRFISGIQRYNWNKFIKEPVKVMESNIARHKTYKLVAEAIYQLQNVVDADLYEEAILKLDRSFALPENQIRSYIKETFADNSESHPIIRQLIEQLYRIPQEKTDNVTFIMTKEGRVSTHERISPLLIEEGRDIIMLNNSLYEIKDNKVRKIKEAHKENLPEKFLRLCEAFTQFVVSDKKMKIADGIYEFAVRADNGKPVYEVDGVPQQGDTTDTMGELSTMGVQSGLVNLLSMVGENINDIVILDNVLSIVPDNGRAVIDIIKLDGKYSINIFDASMGLDELIQGNGDISAMAAVKSDYGIDLAPYVAEEEEGTALSPEEQAIKDKETAELDQELEGYRLQLEEVNNNIQKITDLDEEYRQDDEIKGLEDELKKAKVDLEEKINELELKKNGNPVMEDMAAVVDSLFSEIGAIKNDPDTIDQLTTDQDANAHIQKSGGVTNITDDISIIPVVTLEKQNDKAVVANICLQIGSKIMDKDKFQEMLTKTFEGTKFEVGEEGYVGLATAAFDVTADVPEEVKTDIASVVNSISNVGSGEPSGEETGGEEPIVTDDVTDDTEVAI